MQFAIAALLLLAQIAVPPRTTSVPNNPSTMDVDADGDGWTPAQGDCCDTPLVCPHPELVNPGAFEIPNNGIDDDCDGTVDNARPVCDIGLASNTANPIDFAKTLDLCQTTIENPTIDQRHWGVINAQLLLADGSGVPAASSHAVRPVFGSGNLPRWGASFAVLSTGSAAAPGQTNPAFVAFELGANNGTQSNFPADWFAAHAGVLPAAPNCPAPLGGPAFDPVMLKLRIRVPTNAKSFSVSSRFFASDFAEWVCTQYNDFFLILLDSTYSGSPANPADKNLATIYSTDNNLYPVSVNLASGNAGPFQACVNGRVGCLGTNPGAIVTCTSTAGIAGTGFDSPTPGNCDSYSLLGGATAWLTTTGNVAPGETIELRLILWDTADYTQDSLVLLDNFQWFADPTTPGTYLTGAVPLPAPIGVSATAAGTSVNVTWNGVTSATSYQVLRRGPGEASFTPVGTTTAPAYAETAPSPDTAYLYSVRSAITGYGSSSNSAPDLTTTTSFTDNPVAGGTTSVKAEHLDQLRTAVNAVRQLAGLTAASFTDSTSPDLPIKALHVSELRSALDAALTSLGFPAGGYTDAITPDVPVKGVHFQELRDRVN